MRETEEPSRTAAVRSSEFLIIKIGVVWTNQPVAKAVLADALNQKDLLLCRPVQSKDRESVPPYWYVSMRVLVLLLLRAAIGATGGPSAAEARQAKVKVLALRATNAESPADVGAANIAVKLRMQREERPKRPSGQLRRCDDMRV